MEQELVTTTATEVAKSTALATVKSTVVGFVKDNPVATGVAVGTVATLTVLWAGKKLFGGGK